MEIQIIQVPYDSGHKDFRMGNGPAHIVNRGLKKPGQAGTYIEEVLIENRFPLEVGTTLQVSKALADRVREAVNQSRFPFVLAGGCMSSIGTLAGLESPVGVLWLDAHGDLNTPETTVSGFFDGMALATVTGRCWRNLTGTISGFRAVPDRHAILLGARDFDPAERQLLDTSAVTLIETRIIRQQSVSGALGPALERLCDFTQKVYLHIDLDVLDIMEACVNQFSCSGGLTLAELLDVIRFVWSRSSVAAAAVTAYDPAYDQGDKALQAASEIVALLNNLVRHTVQHEYGLPSKPVTE